ncbi:MAG: protein kinase [Candidatus Margulisiibacteriota bacterium]
MEQLLKSRYKAQEKISENPFSVTYQGITLSTQKPVIIKIYKRGTLNSTLIKSMKQKVQLLSRLEHPNIARLIDGDYGWQGFYYVREYVNGKSLAELKAGRKFDTEEVRQIGLVASEALDRAHQAGIVHGSLSLNNLLVRNDNSIVLTDFVIEGEIKEAQPQKTVYIMEHPEVLSPEEIQGDCARRSSDIYSLGFSLYNLLSKKDLAEQRLGLALKKMKGDLPPLANVDRYMNDILQKALNPDPQLSFCGAQEMRRSFENRSLMGQKAALSDLPPIEMVDRPQVKEEPKEVVVVKKERKRSFYLLIIVVLAIAAGLVYSLVNSYFLSFQ